MDKFKTVKEKKDVYIEFTEQEMEELGWKENQKLSIEVNDDKTIVIKPWVTLELDTSSWSKEIYKMLVDLSLEQNKTVNDVIVDIISKYVTKDNDNLELICENGNV